MNILSILELLPLSLAGVAIILCSIRYGVERRKANKIALICAMLASMGLVVAQSYWWATDAMKCDTNEVYRVTIMLIIYNSLTMFTFIAMSFPRIKHD